MNSLRHATLTADMIPLLTAPAAQYDEPDHAPVSPAPDMEQRAYNQMPKAGWRDLRLVCFDGTDLYQWRGKNGADSVFDDAATEVFRIYRRPAPVPASQVGTKAEGRSEQKAPTTSGEVERLRAALVVSVPRGQLETLRRSLELGNLLPGEGETLINCWIMASDAGATA